MYIQPDSASHFFVSIQFDDKAKEKMTDWIKDDYVGIDDLTTHSIIWNFIMIEVGTCILCYD